MLKRILKYFKKTHNVLSRSACVGKDVYATFKGGEVEYVNIQKGRVDFLLKFKSSINELDLEFIKDFIPRHDVFHLIKEQKSLQWLRSSSDSKGIFLFDTFSELTDQLFVDSKSESAFCAHYSDINHTAEFSQRFKSMGLLPIEDLHRNYDEFFTLIRSQYPNMKFLVVHYSTKYDDRSIYKERSLAIRSILKELESKHNLLNVYLAEDEYFPHEGDDFPYHYSKETYDKLCLVLNRSLNTEN